MRSGPAGLRAKGTFGRIEGRRAPFAGTRLALRCRTVSSERVTYERDGHVATITYARPEKLNAIDGAMRDGLNEAFDRFRADDEAWVGIVTGEGRAFCVGADAGGEGNPAGDFPGSFWERPTVNSFESGWEIYKPVIAAVNGHCLGYGLTLVTWCDLVIASERATFGFPEVRLGIPTIVGAIRLPQRIGWQPAMELLLTGERVDAERAREMGLVSRVVPHDDLLDRGPRPRRPAARRRAPGPARDQGDGPPGAVPGRDRRHPLRRDHAPRRGRDRGRRRGHDRGAREARAPLAGPLRCASGAREHFGVLEHREVLTCAKRTWIR